MGQREVIDWLQQNKGWHPTATIVAALGQGYKGVQLALKKAARQNEIQSRKAQFGKEWSIR